MSTAGSSTALPSSWSDMRLLPPVIEAVLALGWSTPTTVQGASMPALLRGEDVSLQGSTGSGKTAAFAIPVVQRVVLERRSGKCSSPTALVLTPSVELAEQTVEVFDSVSRYIKPRLSIASSCDSTRPPSTVSNVIVGTPAAVVKQLKAGTLPSDIIASLRMIVIDEADVLVAMSSLAVIQRFLPAVVQSVLVSATLNEGVATIKEKLLRNPTNITLIEDEDAGPSAPSATGDTSDVVIDARVHKRNQIRHTYLVATTEAHHHTLLYALFRLGQINGKTLIFVDDEEHTYRLQHFLEQLQVHTVVYDASLPLNARLDVLKRYQRNTQGTMICTDNTLEKAERLQVDLSAEDKETAGLTRGVDFHKVSNVILFDGVPSATALNFSGYTHRAGRTGRAGAEGQVVTLFTVAQSQEVVAPLREYLRSNRGEPFKPLKKLDRAKAAHLQYRVDTALNNVTRNATRKLRVATVASEMARSTYLSAHLKQTDVGALKGIMSKVKNKVKGDKDLTTIPQYMKVKADSAENYRKRVKAQHPMNRDELFARLSKKKALDPLQRVVDKVRNKEVAQKAKAAAHRAKVGAASKGRKGGAAGKRAPPARPKAQ